MGKLLEFKRPVEEGLKELLKTLLEGGKLKAVFTLTKKDDAVFYTLIKDAKKLEETTPLLPLMPVNAGKLLSRLTLKESLEEPIAVVIRPCELHAFVELIKREQGSLKNFLFISMTCGGVLPIDNIAKNELDTKLNKYFESIKNVKVPDEVRPACKMCQNFLPYNADMVVDFWDKDINKTCRIFVNDTGEKYLNGLGFELKNTNQGLDYEEEKFKNLLALKKENEKKILESYKIEEWGMDGLVKIFGKCVGCHSCSRVCPICYCNLCEFDSDQYEYAPSTYSTELEKRGGVRVPPNTILFHLGRLTHVSISCVGCGMCEDVCPVDIPVSIIFSGISKEVQGLFNYTPGKDIKEDLPLSTFKEEELNEFEE